jgi:two-component system, OmpR family, alkaline phosphatase synthesis response regulator PhoP
MLKILVVEDEMSIRHNVEEILELCDYQVLTADNGRTGLELAQKALPDLIISDIMMPKLDGYGMLEELRKNEATATIPVIFLTAKTEKCDLRKGMELGADDYITKPFTPDEVLETVASRWKRHCAYQERLNQEKSKFEAIKAELIKKDEQLRQKLELADIKEELLNKLIKDLSSPISNINLAIKMLQDAESEEKRERYLMVLHQECSKEISLINEISELQNLLTPENVTILQKFNLLKK